MSFSPELVITLLGYVREVVKFVEAIKDAPREMSELNDRMKFLAMYLGSLRKILEKRKQQLAMFTHEQHSILTGIMNGLGDDVRAVNTLYNEWRGNKGPWGLEFRFSFAAKWWHELGPRKEEIAAFGESIDKRRRDLSDALQVMGFDGIYEVLDVVSGKIPSGRLTPEPPAAPIKQPAPIAAPKQDCRIIFVDPYNEGRSIVAEAMAKMLRGWTQQAGGDWRVSQIHSAGYYCRTNSNIENVVAGKLIVPKGANPMQWREGNKSPNPFALRAMFDPSMCRSEVRGKVEPTITRRRSRGIRKSIFKEYDYIVVFHIREYNNLLALKRTLVQQEGRGIAPAGREGLCI